MGLFRKRKRTTRRALRKAHTKNLRAQAQAEKKFAEKKQRKAAKDRNKGKPTEPEPVAVTQVPVNTGDESRAEKKANKKASKKALEQVSTPKKVKNALTISRMLTPVLAPLAYKAATAARTQLDNARARKIGVDVQQLGDFTGHGAALNARIAGLERSLEELTNAHSDSGADAEEFRKSTRDRLGDLSRAVHAAERMPTPRRKAAHRAVARDLDGIDAQLLGRLGVRQ